MSFRLRRHVRKGIVALALLLLASWAIPSFLSADRYRKRLQAELEHTLHRQVTFGAVAFRILPRPGFSIDNAVIEEDPAFGSEPFARVDRINCDLRWSSLWGSRFEFSRLDLDTPDINLVRNTQGQWNAAGLFEKSGITTLGKASARIGGSKGNIEVDAENARIDFSAGPNKKPFALTDVRARLSLDRAGGRLSFRLLGNPVRTDFNLPSPGPVELDGTWTPGANLEGPLDANLQSEGSLLYDWVPLITGRNPEIYGVTDVTARITGSPELLKVAGQARFSQLRRWEQLPPSESMPVTINFRGQVNRARGQVLLESVDGSFADSRIHLSGSVDHFSGSPNLDLVIAVERSRVENFLALARLILGDSGAIGASGRVDGLLDIRGPWPEKQYRGFVSALGVHLTTASGTYPVSEIDLRITREGIRLAPVRLAVAPRVELVAEGRITPASLPARKIHLGSIERRSTSPSNLNYELTLSAKAIPLHDLLNFGRDVGVVKFLGLDAQGSASADLILRGTAWPLGRPEILGRADLRSARLLIPGLTEPLNLPRASIQLKNGKIVASPVVAVIGTSVFSGQIEHQGKRAEAWNFSVKANNLNLEQGALWFDVLGHRQPAPLLEQLTGLSSFLERRTAASNLFSVVHAKGQFSTPAVAYRGLMLSNFKAAVEISDREVRLTHVDFNVGGGRGHGDLVVDMGRAPARVLLNASVASANLSFLTPRLPSSLRKIRGSYSGNGQFETRGLDREEMAANLTGHGTVSLSNVMFGDFDPLAALVLKAGQGTLEPARAETGFRACLVNFKIADRRVRFEEFPVAISGAKLDLRGSFAFDGQMDLGIEADLSRSARAWVGPEPEGRIAARQFGLHLAGPLDKLTFAPEMAASRVNP